MRRNDKSGMIYLVGVVSAEGSGVMARTVSIGVQDFQKIVSNHYFYIDKTMFIKEWWESGFGRYDVMMEPRKKEDNGIILEFKVHDSEDEADLTATVQAALKQIEEKQYEQVLLDRGLEKGRIRKYGFAFEGKKVLIGIKGSDKI